MKTLLPIDGVKNEIIEKVESCPVTVISAETGAGKSTRVPEFLMEAGYDVVVTEPRRIAAVTLAERVSEELEAEVGKVVGFATGFEKNYCEDTKILYATDGLQLVRELNMRASSAKRALVLDEVHEMNLNMEVLIAWIKVQIEKGWDTKVVIMSATLESDEIARYYGEDITSKVEVPGKLFDVSMEKTSKYDMICEIRKAISKNENTLVFLPGKGEIEDMQLSLALEEAKVFPLHGELPYSEQKKCFASYDVPKVILATNVAQTSITVPDIDVVIDSGLERRVETSNGIEGLFIRPCSKKDIIQRKGRAGRTHEGRYVLCSDYSIEEREDFEKPEITRLSLEQVVLRLASVHMDATSLKYLHQPPEEALLAAKNLLITLGALDENLALTEIGRKMAKMPVGARQARMLIEAEKERCMEQMIIIAAILQNGSLLAKGGHYDEILGYINEMSDIIAEMKLYQYISENAPVNFKELRINGKMYFRVKEYVEKLNGIFAEEIKNDFGANNETLIKVTFSAMKDLVFFESGWDEYVNSDETFRGKIVRSSTCYRYSSMLFGFPITVEVNERYGMKSMLNLITLCSELDEDQLVKWAGEFAKVTYGEIKLHHTYMGDPYLAQRVEYSYRGYVYCMKNQEINDPELLEVKKAEYDESEKERIEKLRLETCVKIGDEWYEVRGFSEKYVIIDKAVLTDRSLPLEYEFKGRKIKLYYDGITSMNLDDLRDKELKRALEFKIRSLVGSKERIVGSNQIMEAIKTSCETTVTVELAGKTLSGKIYNYVDVDSNGMYLVVSTDNVEISEKTLDALKATFKAEAEKKFSENAFFFVIKGKRELTNKGSKALSHYRNEKLMVLSQLSLDNYSDSMEYLELAYEEAKAMLG